ncbi:FecR family protein [Flavivirga spongiicola]|uniref:FecR family protein n=1 Tax=Flavivirga spongiicola TaxID=421621 RepID=A0ABU7XUI0_9FLAO|nr:FecR family protein [Flavivirga sp. MEBiC05379]MDO5979094.1 FecR family protein [Flavivirga sp. MEBiC05379]
MDKKTEILITKFLTNEANIDELRQLELWISNPKNEILFFEYIKTNAFANMIVSKYDIKKAKKDILRRIGKEKRKTNSVLKYVAAAVFIGILVSVYFFRDNVFNSPVENIPVIVNSIEAGTDKATLTLSDGSVVALEKGESFKTKNADSNGEQIVYSTAKKSKSSKIAYNYLTIPRGGQFFVKLSDGTQVWLNSESQLKYPENFIDGELRQVELIYGEAYFDVSPSAKHKGSKFKILTDVQEIEVYGTEFNVKAYQDENSIYTTLVEGKVSVKNNSKTEFLKPNQQSIIDASSNTIDIKEVDVNNEISWVRGEFIFYKKPLKEIMKVLSRWYDVTVIFQNKSFESTEFNGELSREQKIEDILDLIKQTKIINAYEINNNTIILK